MKDEVRYPFWISVLRPAQPVAVGEFEKVSLHEDAAGAKIEVSNQENKDGYTRLDITTGAFTPHTSDPGFERRDVDVDAVVRASDEKTSRLHRVAFVGIGIRVDI